MSIIKPPKNETPAVSYKRVKMKTKLLADIKSYCQWAHLKNVDYFLEEAAEYILQKDKDWKDYQKTLLETQPSMKVQGEEN